MVLLLTPFLVLAVVGLALSLVAHAAALLGLPPPLGTATWELPSDLFVVWVPTVLLGSRLSRDAPRKDFWKAVLRGCPAWMRRLAFGFFAYAVVNFLLFARAAPPQVPGAPTPPVVIRAFSGHWMAFYADAAAVLYSAQAVSRWDPACRCPNGHPVPPAAKECAACGAEVIGPGVARP